MEKQQQHNKPNPKLNRSKMKDMKKNEFEFCKVCNLNHDQGRRHNYFPNHTKALSSFLSRFLQKLSDVRFFLKNPAFLGPEHASRNRLWCVFCDSDIEEHDSLFACNNAILHLASSDHLRNLKHFLWKNGGGMDRLDSCMVTEADLTKWVKRCTSLKNTASSSSCGSCEPMFGPLNDIHNSINSCSMGNFKNNTVCIFKSSVSNGVLPLQCYTNEKYQVCQPEVNEAAKLCPILCERTSLPAVTQFDTKFKSMDVMENATMDLTVDRNKQHSIICNSSENSVCQIPSNKSVYKAGRATTGKSSCQVLQNFTQNFPRASKEPEGNVHSGAPPPWFDVNEENQKNVQINSRIHQENLSSPLDKLGKSRKLNPKRVGAAWAEKRKIELELERRGEVVTNYCDADWLPNFGRVWQSGSRKESRKEFEVEKQELLKVDKQSETPTRIQPYISKRMRRDASESDVAIDGQIGNMNSL